jgi:hypothetical protein
MQIPKNISAITTGITSASNLILINPQTNIGYYQQPVPIPAGVDKQKSTQQGFLFDYEGENSLTLESDITDHFVENNKTVSDQISVKPVVVSVQGFVGELKDFFYNPDSQIINNANNFATIAQSKLKTLSPYVPEVSAAALLVINEAILAAEVLANTSDAIEQTYDFAFNKEYLNKQQKAFSKFYQAYQQRVLFTIQTPWLILDNMAIKSLRAIQSADTRMITDFEIQFKQINFVQSKTYQQVLQERAAAKFSSLVNLGTNAANESVINALDQFKHMGSTG